MTPPSLAALYGAHLEELQAAVLRALATTGFDALVVSSGCLVSKSRFDDQDFPFRPTPTFAHFLPLVEPDALVVVRAGQRPRLLRGHVPSYWEGPTPIACDHALPRFEQAELSPERHRGELPSGRVAFVGDDAERGAALGLGPAAINPPALLAELDALRSRKSDYERWCMAEASRIAAHGHEVVREVFLLTPASELQLHLDYLSATSQDDAETPYKNIVAQGAHAGVLHHIHYGREVIEGDTALLVDAGATCHGYASDVTRTWVRGDGAAAGEFAALVAAVDAMQQAIVARIAIGRPYEALHDQAHELLAEVLIAQGLCRGPADALVAGGVTRAFLPHGLGHSLGLQVHDVGMKLRPPRADNPYLRNTSDIAAGQVFTIEPGCYFIASLLGAVRAGPAGALVDWAKVDRLSRFGGIRIEDDIAVLDAGVDNLTRQHLSH